MNKEKIFSYVYLAVRTATLFLIWLAGLMYLADNINYYESTFLMYFFSGIFMASLFFVKLGTKIKFKGRLV